MDITTLLLLATPPVPTITLIRAKPIRTSFGLREEKTWPESSFIMLTILTKEKMVFTE
jgi:hypothetical protein